MLLDRFQVKPWEMDDFTQAEWSLVESYIKRSAGEVNLGS